MEIRELDRKQRFRTIIYFDILLGLLVLLVAASYTWFSLSHTPNVSGMEMYVTGSVGIQLAETFDAEEEEWGTILDFQSLIGENTVLQPASWSAKENSFVTAAYGTDGRTIENRFTVLTDEQNANRSDEHAYYVKGTFYARSDTVVDITLGEAVEINEGENTAGTYVIGTPVWDEQRILHDDGGLGAETAIRVGIRVTPVDSFTGAVTGESDFYIYEPNYDVHIDPNLELEGDGSTLSVDGGVYEDAAYVIYQTASTWSEAYPVQKDVTIKQLGEFVTDTYLFSLGPGDMVKIDLYLWLEGQDVDCTNLIDKAQIFANVQFSAVYSGQSGLDKIPGR